MRTPNFAAPFSIISSQFGELRVFLDNSSILAGATLDGTVLLWNPATGRPIGQPLTGHTATVNGVAFSPNGRILASASDDKTVRLWDMPPPPVE